MRDEITALLGRALAGQEFDICWCNDPWCQMVEPPTLHLTDEGEWDDVAQIALHEAAHLLDGLRQPTHGEPFWELLEGLVQTHLGRGLNERQAKMKRDYLSV